MLTKKERLKDRYLFNLAFKKKQKLHSNLVSLYYLFKRSQNASNDSDITQNAFVTGLNISKKATIRNRIKRRMREAYQSIRKSECIDITGLSRFQCLIWIAHPSVIDATFVEIKGTIKNLLIKLVKLKEQNDKHCFTRGRRNF